MNPKTFIANSVWKIATLTEYIRFKRSLQNPEQAQFDVLMNILRNNQNCFFGERNQFIRIRSIDQFQKNVPLSTYNDYEPFIVKLIHEGKNLLTRDSIISLSLTSGTTSPSKHIPLTKSLKRQFEKGISPWIHNMFKQYPKLKHLPSFWIITPNTQNPKSKSGIKIGFDEDSSYFNMTQRWILSNTLCLPDWVSKIQDQHSFFYVLSFFLLREKNVGFMSFWSPTLLPSILLFIVQNKKELIEAIDNGDLKVEASHKTIHRYFKPFKQRAIELNHLIKKQEDKTKWKKIWPNIQLISSWADGWSRELVDTCISKYFPGIPFQPKGLLATEYIASIPWNTEKTPVLCPTTHFFEFIDQNTDNIYLMHQIQTGKKYEIVVTTGGGLYRYQTGDIVQVTNQIEKTPTIEFLNKREITTDLCGEKINHRHVKQAIVELCKEFQLAPDELYVCPAQEGARSWYYLLISSKMRGWIDSKHEIEQTFDKLLKQNYHYRHCRNLGQLDTPRIIIYDYPFLNRELYRGRLSTRKPISLISQINFQNKLLQYNHYVESNS